MILLFSDADTTWEVLISMELGFQVLTFNWTGVESTGVLRVCQSSYVQPQLGTQTHYEEIQLEVARCFLYLYSLKSNKPTLGLEFLHRQ